jgi:hypothetical protein
VLDDVDDAYPVEGAVLEWIGEAVQVAEDVRPGPGVLVDADGPRILIDSAADV